MAETRADTPPVAAPAEGPGAAAEESTVFFERRDDTLMIGLTGTWSLDVGLPPIADLQRELTSVPAPKRVAFNTDELGAWDSALVTFVARAIELSRARGIEVDRGALPPGLLRLLALAEAVAETRVVRAARPAGLLTRIGQKSVAYGQAVIEALAFVGEFSIAFVNLLRGRARYQVSDLTLTIQQCGANALGIVSLISFLVGVILAFMGAVQLQKVGAQIFVANLVAIGMVREMGAMMTAISCRAAPAPPLPRNWVP